MKSEGQFWPLNIYMIICLSLADLSSESARQGRSPSFITIFASRWSMLLCQFKLYTVLNWKGFAWKGAFLPEGVHAVIALTGFFQRSCACSRNKWEYKHISKNLCCRSRHHFLILEKPNFKDSSLLWIVIFECLLFG